jgi:hypothetical protein
LPPLLPVADVCIDPLPVVVASIDPPLDDDALVDPLRDPLLLFVTMLIHSSQD